jgi:hypothetical protein
MKLAISAVLGAALLTCGADSHGAEDAAPQPPCAAETMHQFDFWIGNWEVTANGKPAGTNRIERILDGCALLENWTGAGGGAGKSLNFFDRTDGLWHQTWIDRNGGALFLAGRFENGSMRLAGERPATAKQPAARHRITWTALPGGQVRQLWETAPVGKEAWTVLFDGLYQPSK